MLREIARGKPLLMLIVSANRGEGMMDLGEEF